MDKKICHSCKITKPRTNFHKDASKKDKLDARCKACSKIKDRIRGVSRYYGITFEQKVYLLQRQENKCAICKKIIEREDDSCVDHHHETKAIRGILCRNCNAGLGLFKDNPKSLREAARYVLK